MPWRASKIVNERMRFVIRHENGERMTDLCREFGVSRKTGYKLWQRYQELGPAGLFDRSRAPERRPHRTPEAVEGAILALKKEYPTWGSKKLRVELRTRIEGVHVPARSTIDEILKRHGLTKPRKKRRRTPRHPDKLRVSRKPNEVWCADFKGQFRLGNGRYCYPLTVSDHFSRYLIACEALEATKSGASREVFEQAFELYGLPEAIRTDNGAPFASTGLHGLSKLSVWFMQLGIRPERIEPAHPEQNGRHERMHLTLKLATTRPAANGFLQQQERFDHFRAEYNDKRPHEALEMNTPASQYRPSGRTHRRGIAELSYPLHDDVLKVAPCGHVRLPGGCRKYFLSEVLAGQPVGVRELEDRRWLVTFGWLDLGHLDLSAKTFVPLVPAPDSAGSSTGIKP